MNPKICKQSPQADFKSPVRSLMRGAQQDFTRRARSRSDIFPHVRVRILAERFSYRKFGAISYTKKRRARLSFCVNRNAGLKPSGFRVRG